MRVYSIWYKDLGTSPDPKTLSQIERYFGHKPLSRINGDFWRMKHLQHEPERGETIAWGQIHKDMVTELNENWWLMGYCCPTLRPFAERKHGKEPRPGAILQRKQQQPQDCCPIWQDKFR